MKFHYSLFFIRSTVAFAILSAWLITQAAIVRAAPGDENWDNRFGSPGIGGIFSPSVSAIAVSGTDVYVGGQFTQVNGIPAMNIAKWNGNAWSALANGLGTSTTSVLALAVAGTSVYAGGSFTTSGGTGVSRIARWDGANWSQVGGGVDETVFALASDGTNLYAGGSFGTAGGPGSNANAVARWDGTQWHPLSGPLGNGAGGAVFSIAVLGSDVFIGGNFFSAGLTLGVNNGISAKGIARWTGSEWFALGSGLAGFDYRAQALAVMGSDLYVGGHFTSAGGINTKGVAKWTGTEWVSLSGISGNYEEVLGLATSGGNVFAAGTFSAAGGITATNIAQWNGSTWYPLGSGIGDDIYYGLAAAATPHELYAGGNFFGAGGKSSRFFARYAFVPTATEFSSAGMITIPGFGAAAPYPSTITVSGINGTVSSVKVKLNGFSHELPNDVDVFLVAPGGRVCSLLSDAGGEDAVNGLNLVFDDAAGMQPSNNAPLTSGTWHPVNYDPSEALPPGGTGSIGTNLPALATGGVNGDWKLFVSDDEAGDSGSISSWTLVLESTSLTALENWRKSHFGSTANSGNGADSADPDTDGIPNLVEFGLGLNPNENSAGQLPQGQLAGSDFVIGFTQPTGVSGITWGAEWSATMLPGSWTGITDTGISPEHRFRTPMGANTKIFVRLRVAVQ